VRKTAVKNTLIRLLASSRQKGFAHHGIDFIFRPKQAVTQLVPDD